MRDGLGFDPIDDGTGEGDQEAPICTCGVTAIPSTSTTPAEPTFVCENPDCEAFGQRVD